MRLEVKVSLSFRTVWEVISLSLFAEKLTLSKASGPAPLGAQTLSFSVLEPAGAAEPHGERDQSRLLTAGLAAAWHGTELQQMFIKEHVRGCPDALAMSLQLSFIVCA